MADEPQHLLGGCAARCAAGCALPSNASTVAGEDLLPVEGPHWATVGGGGAALAASCELQSAHRAGVGPSDLGHLREGGGAGLEPWPMAGPTWATSEGGAVGLVTLLVGSKNNTHTQTHTHAHKQT